MNIPCPDKPIDDPYVWELIELDLHNIDKSWWPTLSAMAVSVPLLGFDNDYGPKPPKQPIQLKMYLHSYAADLFNEEFKRYPKDDPNCLPHWALKLAGRVEARIMQRIDEMETRRFRNLITASILYHGVTEIEMRETIRQCLKGLIEAQVPSEPQKQELAPTKALPIAESNEPTSVPVLSEIERRKKLLEEYKAAAGDPSDYRIYNAENSGIHKAEFYDWKKGVLPSQSKTARRLESFLREKKPPIPRKS